jgi:uncharacterized protein (DUF58 family)
MKLTREGRRFLVATLLIIIAAISTGNNLIYLILSLMLSFLSLAYLMLWINLAGLSLDISPELPVYAGQQAFASLIVHNRKRIHAYSLIIRASDVEGSVYCAMVQAGGELTRQMKLVFRKRGLYGYRDFSVESGFPFILFRKKIAVNIPGGIIVYPRLLDIEDIAGELEDQAGSGENGVLGGGEEVYALRRYRYGDDRKKVHWKASARRSALIVKEHAGHISKKVTILIDNLLPRDEAAFEKVVSVAASLAAYFIEQGYSVRLISCSKVIPFGTGTGHLFTVLDSLALLQEEREWRNIIVPDMDGFDLYVLKSHSSSLAQQATSAGLVVHADTL